MSPWSRAQALCAARARRVWAALADRLRQPVGTLRPIAALRSATEIRRSARKWRAGTICAFSIPAPDRCPAGSAMWWSEGSCRSGFLSRGELRDSLRGLPAPERDLNATNCGPTTSLVIPRAWSWPEKFLFVFLSARKNDREIPRFARNDKRKKERTLRIAVALALLLLTALNARATTYYVAAAGSDTNNGTSSSTPWQTIAKVNASTFSPGDSILFNRGDAWYGTALTVPSAGSSGNPITFGAYGTGANPILKGSTLLTTSGYSLAPNSSST